ncbi:phage tail tube assembly chaperone [Levilactobacillus namurensis]|uniref:Phage tail tube assembly chaperone n=1 Tax=Levilactobacillus namurensis TaxID=380393 RepID=A0AAW8WAG1_9LACO|nr:phage tail tube assembly chaperone [Levilactobacillus namurensis]MDT7015296.1 phage tail tube assembly chaperone [Levilactobacillus namurensis]
MTVKVNAKVLGIKEPVEIKESNRNFQKTLLIQKQMLKVEAMPDDASDMDMLDAAIEANQAMTDYITDMLRLKTKEKHALGDLTTDETAKLIQAIIAGIQHQDITDIEDAQKKESADNEELSETEKK